MKKFILIFIYNISLACVCAQADTIKTQLHFKDFFDLPVGATFQYLETSNGVDFKDEKLNKYTIISKSVDSSLFNKRIIDYRYDITGFIEDIYYWCKYPYPICYVVSHTYSYYSKTLHFYDSINNPLNQRTNDWANITLIDYDSMPNYNEIFLTKTKAVDNDSVITFGGYENIFNITDTTINYTIMQLEYKYAKGIGLIYKNIFDFESGYSIALDGYIIGPSQYGTVYPDSSFTVGINNTHPCTKAVSIKQTETPNVYTIETNTPETIVSIYTINGQLLFSNNTSKNNQTIDLSGYTKGIYVVKIVGDNFSETLKIVKQ